MLIRMKENGFRTALSNQLSDVAFEKKYEIPNKFPILSRYTRFADYSVKDIINDSVTSTMMYDFNDVFDGVIHRQKMDNIAAIIENKWFNYVQLYKQLGMQTPQNHDEYIVTEKRKLINQETLDSFLSSYVGMYICCFSTQNDSVLMWSHYAESNKGLCVSYDFNQLESNNNFRSYLFPVAYSDEPSIISQINHNEFLSKYGLEMNLLCNSLTKSKKWDYENEWRIIFQNPLSDYPIERRLQLKLPIKPIEISFGYHFFKQFFCYNDNEYEKIKVELIPYLEKLLEYISRNNIKISFMRPIIGTYNLKPHNVSIGVLKQFVDKYIKIESKSLKSIKYYNTILCTWNQILAEEQNNE